MDEEITAAQSMAKEIGIDLFEFNLCHTWQRSKRFTTMEHIKNNPLFHQFARVEVSTRINQEVDNIGLWEEHYRNIFVKRPRG